MGERLFLLDGTLEMVQTTFLNLNAVLDLMGQRKPPPWKKD